MFWLSNRKIILYYELLSRRHVCSCALEKYQKSVWHGNGADGHLTYIPA